jgi:hypothetical protein
MVGEADDDPCAVGRVLLMEVIDGAPQPSLTLPPMDYRSDVSPTAILGSSLSASPSRVRIPKTASMFSGSNANNIWADSLRCPCASWMIGPIYFGRRRLPLTSPTPGDGEDRPPVKGLGASAACGLCVPHGRATGPHADRPVRQLPTGTPAPHGRRSRTGNCRDLARIRTVNMPRRTDRRELCEACREFIVCFGHSFLSSTEAQNERGQPDEWP